MLCNIEIALIPSHAFLANRVERLYLAGDIMVLVATATLAWGVNLPARLVIVKGTEYYDGKKSRYVDYPLTDVLQMIGRAGRPGFDTEGRAVVLVESSKKNFYKVRCILSRTNHARCNRCSHISRNTRACCCFSY
jgi:replicative superfamily II helicase